MLTLDNVTIHLQDFGTVLCIHLVSTSKEAIEQRYNSFFNHETTGGDLDWENDVVSPYHAYFWVYSGRTGTAEEKVKMGLIRGSFCEILNGHESTKGRNIWPDACRIGLERFAKIDHVTWLNVRTEVEIYGMGDSVTAEKGTGNFDDEVLAKVVTRGGTATLEMIKAQTKDTEHDYEKESVGEDV